MSRVHHHQPTNRGEVRARVEGLELPTDMVGIASEIVQAPDGQRAAVWCALRGDGQAALGWFTAPGCLQVNAYAGAFPAAAELLNGAPSGTLVTSSTRLGRDVSVIQSGQWDAYYEANTGLDEVHLVPEILRSAKSALEQLPAFSILPHTENEATALLSYNASRLQSAAARRLRAGAPADAELITDFQIKLSREEKDKKRRSRRWEGNGRRVYIPGLDREWECLPIGAALAAAIDGGWEWRAVTGDGRFFSGRLNASDKFQAAQHVADACQTDPSFLTVWMPTTTTAKEQRRKLGRFTSLTPGAQDCPDLEDAQAVAVELSVEAKTRMLPPARELMTGYVDSWEPPPAAIPADPYLVAADASHRGRVAAWACVTGAGWVASRPEYHLVTEGSHEAELIALIHAMRLYPNGTDITVLTDNQDAVTIAHTIQGIRSLDELPPRVAWLHAHQDRDREMAEALAAELDRLGEVVINWIPRNSHPLHARADDITRRTYRKRAHSMGAKKRGFR